MANTSTVTPLREMKHGPLDDTEIEEIARLVDRGLSGYHISVRLNRHKSTVYHAIARLSLRAPRLRSFDFIRNGARVVSFSEHEDILMKVLRMQGYSVATIARTLTTRFGHPRSQQTVGTRLRQLAALDAAKEKEAHHG